MSQPKNLFRDLSLGRPSIFVLHSSVVALSFLLRIVVDRLALVVEVRAFVAWPSNAECNDFVTRKWYETIPSWTWKNRRHPVRHCELSVISFVRLVQCESFDPSKNQGRLVVGADAVPWSLWSRPMLQHSWEALFDHKSIAIAS